MMHLLVWTISALVLSLLAFSLGYGAGYVDGRREEKCDLADDACK